MKKLICILLVISFFGAFAACGKEPTMEEVLETAETLVELTGSSGGISIDESVARSLLEVYPQKVLGLSKELYDYDLKLSATRFSGSDACLVEAFLEGAENPEGTFVILGQQCFVYDSESQKYLLLTLKGAVEYNESVSHTGDEPAASESTFEYDENNNKALHKKFDSYTKKQLGLDKEIQEYILVVPGTTTTAADGSMVYVVRLYEKTGEAINHTVAFNDSGDYMFDYEANRYIKLK